ncbi:hypothetical protein, partial [Pseudomonas fluorescens]
VKIKFRNPYLRIQVGVLFIREKTILVSGLPESSIFGTCTGNAAKTKRPTLSVGLFYWVMNS